MRKLACVCPLDSSANSNAHVPKFRSYEEKLAFHENKGTLDRFMLNDVDDLEGELVTEFPEDSNFPPQSSSSEAEAGSGSFNLQQDLQPITALKTSVPDELEGDLTTGA